MKTKNLVRTIALLVTLAVASPVTYAGPAPTPAETNEEHASRLQNRLEEIHAMDIKKLSKEEKKALRGEVKTIKKELKVISGGVYLSVGAILLIVLLIILLA
jgi:hypothetical protein